MKKLVFLMVCLATAACIGMPAAAGVILVADAGNNVIQKFDANTGSYIGVFATNGLNQPSKIAYGQDQKVYVVNRGNNTITRYSANGDYLGVFASAGLNQPICFDWGPDGNLYVGNRGTEPTPWVDSNIVKIDGTTGAYLGEFIANDLGQNPQTLGMVLPMSVRFGPGGDFFIGNEWFLVSRFSSSGSFIELLGGINYWSGRQYWSALVTTSDYIYGLAADGWVARWQFGQLDTQEGYLNLGYGWWPDMTILADGRMLISEHLNQNVLVYDMINGGSPYWLLSGGPGFNTIAGITYVPEPGTLFALGSGLVGLAGIAFRRRK